MASSTSYLHPLCLNSSAEVIRLLKQQARSEDPVTTAKVTLNSVVSTNQKMEVKTNVDGTKKIS